MATSDDLIGSDTAASYERVPPSSDMLLQVAEFSSPKKPNILRSGNRTSAVQTPAATGSKPAPAPRPSPPTPRIVSVSGATDVTHTQQSHAMMTNATGPRSDASGALRLNVTDKANVFFTAKTLISDSTHLPSRPQDGAGGNAGACRHDITRSEDLNRRHAATTGNNGGCRAHDHPHQHLCHQRSCC